MLSDEQFQNNYGNASGIAASITIVIYSIEGRQEGGPGQNPAPNAAPPRTQPSPKCGAARFAHPLRGAEILVAVRGPSPGEGGGKNVQSPKRKALKEQAAER